VLASAIWYPQGTLPEKLACEEVTHRIITSPIQTTEALGTRIVLR